MAQIQPKQKVTKAEKTPEWYKQNAIWIKEQANFFSGDRWELNMLYEAAMGIINKDNYKYVLNPYNTPEENIRKYPAQIRNYDIITPIIGLYVGEKGEKPFNHQVISVNADAPNQNSAELNQAVEAAMAQHVVNQLNEQGFPTGVQSQDVPPIDKIVEQHNENFNDKRAMFGQEALDFIKYDLNLKDKYQEAIYDWIVTGRTYTYKDVYKDDLLHQIVPPMEIWHGTSDSGFVEDSNWAMRRTRYSLSDCIDRFHEVLSDKPDGDNGSEIDILEGKFRNGNTTTSAIFLQSQNIDKVASSGVQNEFANNGGLIDVFHCVWKSFRKYGILTYTDEMTGQPSEMEIDEDYVMDESKGDISVEWHWENQVEETYIIGDQELTPMYKYMRPIQIQRSMITNTSKCKLPYNGRTGYSERNRISSIVKQLLPYQVLYNIYHFRGELTLARNKDKIMLMPKGLMPEGWTEDKFLYFAEATGVAFFDETKPNAAAVLNAIRGIDMGLGTYISQMRELLGSLKMEAWDAVGMNRQRYGDIKASDGKGNTDQATLRSAVISSEMFRRFQRFEESDLQGLLDYSKVAWINGKKGMYINSDGRRAWLDVDPEQHLESDYGVFAVDSAQEAQKLETARQYAFGWAQKGSTPASTVMEVLDSNNMAKLKDFVKKAEKINQDFEQQQQQAEQQNSQMLSDKETAREKAANETKIEVAQIIANGTIESSNIKAKTEANKLDAESNKSEDPAVNNAYDKYLETVRDSDRKKQEAGMKAGAEIGKQRLQENKLSMEDKKIQSSEKIARMNKN